MKSNVKTIRITIPNEFILNRIMKTPTLSKYTRLKLKVGDNIERVNHYQYAGIMRMYPVAGAQVAEVI